MMMMMMYHWNVVLDPCRMCHFIIIIPDFFFVFHRISKHCFECLLLFVHSRMTCDFQLNFSSGNLKYTAKLFVFYPHEMHFLTFLTLFGNRTPFNL